MGECNDDTISHGQLRTLYEAGQMPPSVLVWPTVGGHAWTKLGDVMHRDAKRDRLDPSRARVADGEELVA